jgi:hypothetical protein
LGLFLGIGQQQVRAQNAPYSPYGRSNYSPYSRPTVSPYLNIIRGNNPAVNYFTGTIPERENRVRFNQVNADLQNLEQSRPGAPAPTTGELIPSLPETGHFVQFMSVYPYYNYSPGFNSGYTQVGGQFNRPGAGAQPPRR